MTTRNPVPDRDFIMRVRMTRQRKGLLVLAARWQGMKLEQWVDELLEREAIKVEVALSDQTKHGSR